MKDKILFVFSALLIGISIGLLIDRFSLQKPIAASITPTPTNEPTPSPTETPPNSDELLKIINNWRLSENLQPYTKDERLCKIADDRVDDPDDDHSGFYAKYSNYPYAIAENKTGAYSSKDAIDRWLNSPSHKKTLQSEYKYTCIACEQRYCVQIFSNL